MRSPETSDRSIRPDPPPARPRLLHPGVRTSLSTAAVVAAALLLACPSGSGSRRRPRPVDLTVTVDPGSAIGDVSALLFGINIGWEDRASRVLLGGELARDRSFRLQGTPEQAWIEIPGGGTIAREAALGDATPTGHPGYPGSLRLSSPAAGQVVVAQVLLAGVRAGVDYTLHLSSFAESAAAPPITAALADGAFAAVAGPVFDATASGAWTRHALTLTPTADADPAHLIVGIGGAGTVLVDEVRLSESGSIPLVDPAVVARLQDLGATSLRYPGGTLGDTFDWTAAIGAPLDRGEIEAAFGDLQTPSFGVDEFLGLCEQAGLEPLFQMNVLDAPSKVADLVEYTNGGAATPQGAIRAANGHPAPYGVTWWEIGNEPTAAYQTGPSPDDTGADYAQLALAVAAAARAVDPSIRLGGIAHTQFARADWIAAVPLLDSWNDQVFGGAAPLTPAVDFAHNHFYSYHGDDPDPAVRFRHLMAGGATLAAALGDVDALTGSLPGWLTEYHAIVDDGSIRPEFLVDFQSGLVVADLLLTAIDEGLEGAHLHNLAEPVGFGALVRPGAWDLRPAGHVFALLSPLAGETRVAAAFASPTETIATGNGAIPSGIVYDHLGVLATRTAGGGARVVLLNRAHDASYRVGLSGLGGGGRVTVYRYENDDLSASNEAAADVVRVTARSVRRRDPLVLDLEPHSLVRVDLP